MSDIFGAIGNVIGAGINYFGQQETNANNIAMQQEFAQNGISWKVADAKRAGINPLYALGAQTNSFSDVIAPSVGDSIGQAGQDLGRAAAASASHQTKLEMLQEQLLQAQIDGLHADVTKQQLFNSHLAREFAAPGSNTSNGIPLPSPDPRYATERINAAQKAIMPDGSIAVIPTKEFTGGTFAMDPAGPLWAAKIESDNVDTSFQLRPDVIRGIGILGNGAGQAVLGQ